MNQCSKKKITINLETKIGWIQIDGCSQGLHSVKRVNNALTAERHKRSLNTQRLMFNNDIKYYRFNDDNLLNNDELMNYPTIKQTLEWFRKYFNNEQSLIIPNSQLPLPFCPMVKCSDFAMRVYEKLTQNVKYGQHCTYSELAAMVGHLRAHRAVGSALKNNPLSIIIPCHRVVLKSGKIGKYGGKEDSLKQWLLDHEKNFK